MSFSTKNHLISILIYSLIFVSETLFGQKGQDSLFKYSYLELDDLIHSSPKHSLQNAIYLNYYYQKANRENNNKEMALYYKNYVFYQKQENRIAFIDSAFFMRIKAMTKLLLEILILLKD